MFGQPPQNPNNLIVIKTARTLEKINEAATNGFWPLIKPVEPNPKIHNMVAVYQNRKTGEIELSGDSRYRPDKEQFECVLPHRYYYPYSFESPFAAYLIPSELKEGQHVWLDDLIEDIIAVYGNQGYHPRLESCEAIWLNGDFDIQFNSNRDAPRWIG